MSTITNELLPNENILYHTKPHWVVFAAPIGWLSLALALYTFAHIYDLNWLRLDNASPLHQIIIWIFLGFAAFSGTIASVNYLTTDYTITNRRVLMRTGLIHQVTTGILLQKIEVIRLFQSIQGRFLGYGNIVIIGVGGTHDPFLSVPDPQGFRKKVQTQIHP